MTDRIYKLGNMAQTGAASGLRFMLDIGALVKVEPDSIITFTPQSGVYGWDVNGEPVEAGRYALVRLDDE